jgi:hypothetical protein
MSRAPCAEIRATATKAARGAGHDWGMAEEAGVAARVLESHDLPGVHVLARLLSGAGGPQRRNAGCVPWRRCPTGCPSRRRHPRRAGGGPLLLAAPLILIAREQGTSHTLRWDGAISAAPPTAWSAQGSVDADIAARVSRWSPPRAGPMRRVARLAQPHPSRRRLGRAGTLAAKTLVPETAASRALGAGPADTSVRLKEPEPCR